MCKDDGRGDGGEGETEAESRLSHAVIKREEAHDEFTEPVRHLHTPGETLGRRYVCVNLNHECVCGVSQLHKLFVFSEGDSNRRSGFLFFSRLTFHV